MSIDLFRVIIYDMGKKIIISALITVATVGSWLVFIKKPDFLNKIIPQKIINETANNPLSSGSIKVDGLQNLKGLLEKIPLSIKNCVTEKIGPDALEKIGSGQSAEIINAIQSCALSGTGGIDSEALKKIQNYYNNGSSAQGIENSFNQILDLNALQKIQEDFYKNLTPEELEYIKQQQEQAEDITPITPPQQGGSGMGL